MTNDYAVIADFPLVKNSGGPSEYLYNLKKASDEQKLPIDFLVRSSTNSKQSVNNQKENIKSIRKRLKYSLIGYMVVDFLNALSLLRIRYVRTAKTIQTKYKLVHFHNCVDILRHEKEYSMETLRILTCHTPEAWECEVRDYMQTAQKTKYSFPLSQFMANKCEKAAMKRADAFIFPSEEACNSYKQNIKNFRLFGVGKPIFYLYTGAPKQEVTLSREDYLAYKGISSEMKVVAYIGRHNNIKGYDILIDAFNHLVSKNELNDAVFVCAGSIGMIQPPIHERWIEIGRISDVGNLINAASIVVLPNRQTYFDLVAIQVLSCGAILLASDCGGNISISNETDGVVLFKTSSPVSLADHIRELLLLPDEEILKLKRHNVDAYNDNFSMKTFSERYYKLISHIASTLKRTGE